MYSLGHVIRKKLLKAIFLQYDQVCTVRVCQAGRVYYFLGISVTRIVTFVLGISEEI